jgi:hypothetical protein
MILVAISIGWKVVVLTLGSAVPRWVIGDGLDRIPLASRAYAEEAKLTAMTLWDHPLERLGIVRALRVTRVDSIVAERDSLSAKSASESTAGCRSRSATVVAYTYFAIPYSQARTACNTGVVEYRVFRRRS